MPFKTVNLQVQYWNTLILRNGEHGTDEVLAAGDLPIYVESDAAGVVQPANGVGAVRGRQGNGVSERRGAFNRTKGAGSGKKRIWHSTTLLLGGLKQLLFNSGNRHSHPLVS